MVAVIFDVPELSAEPIKGCRLSGFAISRTIRAELILVGLIMPWTGPFTIGALLEKCLESDRPWPPENPGVYVVTCKSWEGEPDEKAVILYVGSITGKSNRFVTRIGDLIADLYGFFGKDTGHHSGGRSLHEWCVTKRVHPSTLFVAWKTDFPCARCAEYEVWEQLDPSENQIKPPRCKLHGR